MHDYSSTQVNLPDPLSEKILEFGKQIPDSSLAEDGREEGPHITLLYGIHSEDPDVVERVLSLQRPVRAKLKALSIFPASELHAFDVLKIDVESSDLARLHALLRSKIANTQSFPKYNPHATIAYLKAGHGRKYAGRPLQGVSGKEITFDTVIFSGKDGSVSELKLGGYSAFANPERAHPLLKEMA